jgi:P27 family predicted phage terminase small subunit
MGARGPAPQPVELKVLHGNPGKRRLNTDRPKPKPGATVPAWLPATARAEWARVMPELTRLGLVTVVDVAALSGYCLAWAQLQQAQAILDVEGLTMTLPSGYAQQRPEVSIVHKSLGLIKAFCAEFGFTPSARGRMTAGATPETPEGDDLLD